MLDTVALSWYNQWDRGGVSGSPQRKGKKMTKIKPELTPREKETIREAAGEGYNHHIDAAVYEVEHEAHRNAAERFAQFLTHDLDEFTKGEAEELIEVLDDIAESNREVVKALAGMDNRELEEYTVALSSLSVCIRHVIGCEECGGTIRKEWGHSDPYTCNECDRKANPEDYAGMEAGA